MSAEKTNAPYVILVSGLPGSGKSYFALRLSEKMECTYLSSDRIRLQMVRNPRYSESEKILVYTRLLEEIEKALAEGKTIVVDATFVKRDLRELFRRKVRELKGQFRLIRLYADENLIRSRLHTKRPYSDADFEVYKKLKAEYEDILMEHLDLDSGKTSIDEMLTRATEYIYSV